MAGAKTGSTNNTSHEFQRANRPFWEPNFSMKLNNGGWWDGRYNFLPIMSESRDIGSQFGCRHIGIILWLPVWLVSANIGSFETYCQENGCFAVAISFLQCPQTEQLDWHCTCMGTCRFGGGHLRILICGFRGRRCFVWISRQNFVSVRLQAEISMLPVSCPLSWFSASGFIIRCRDRHHWKAWPRKWGSVIEILFLSCLEAEITTTEILPFG